MAVMNHTIPGSVMFLQREICSPDQEIAYTNYKLINSWAVATSHALTTNGYSLFKIR